MGLLKKILSLVLEFILPKTMPAHDEVTEAHADATKAEEATSAAQNKANAAEATQAETKKDLKDWQKGGSNW